MSSTDGILIKPDGAILLDNDNKIPLCDECSCNCCPDAEAFLSGVTLCAFFRSNDACKSCFDCLAVLMQDGGPYQWGPVGPLLQPCGLVTIALICNPDVNHTGCDGYQFILQCTNTDTNVTTVVKGYPTTCTCAPFVLEYDLALPDCCGGTVHVRVTFGCPSTDCAHYGLTCCCQIAPAAWVVQASGFTDGPFCTCSDFNGTFTLAAITTHGDTCLYQSQVFPSTNCPGFRTFPPTPNGFYWQLSFGYSGFGTLDGWFLTLIMEETKFNPPGSGDSDTPSSEITNRMLILVSCFDCLGPSAFYTDGQNSTFGWCKPALPFIGGSTCCASIPVYIECAPAT